MIRIGLPFPALFKMSLRAQLASARLSRAIRRMMIAGEDEPEAFCVVMRPSESPELDPIDLDKFTHRYQDLIDLLCVSAKEGAESARSKQYLELQDWFGRNYGIYRGILRPHLHLDQDQADPFEVMFMHSSLRDAINANDLIFHAQRTRSALESCRNQAERTRV
jgi:hypothetical protein